MGLKYKYTPRFGPVGVEYDPLVDVVYRNPKNGKSIEVRSLIDSGAAGIILHGQFAELLGINPELGKLHEFQGIAHTPVRAYDHELTIRLKEDRHEYRIMCSIMPDLSTSALLGQRGFFDNYKVTFERYNQRIELTPRLPEKP